MNPSGVFLIAPSVFAEHARRLLAQRRFVFTDIGRVRGDIDEAHDVGMDAGLGDDRAAVAVADEQRGAVLQIENPLRRRDIVGKRRLRLLHHA